MKKAAFRLLAGGLLILLASCGVAGLISPTESFNSRETLTLEKSRNDILDVVAEVGESMGYRISGLDKELGSITLSPKAGAEKGLSAMLIGKSKETFLHVNVKDDGRALDIRVDVVGNFGQGGQEAARKIVDDFKAKLLAKIKGA